MPATIATVLTNPAKHWPEAIDLFNGEILPRVIKTMNEDMSIHQIAKLATELLPENERNLTDARTRIGVLLEYSLAVYMDKYFNAIIGPGHRVGFVVANRFPDLISRDPDHQPLLRIEVKCIQSAAEEKSANLDALIRDIWRQRDLLCVLVWEWREATRGKSPVDYPHVYSGFVFDAYTIAKVRDWGWLNEPKPTMTNDVDVSTAVVRKSGTWKKEEKNLGKLMRIADPDALARPPLNRFLEDPTVIHYLNFKQFVIELAIPKCWERVAKKAGCTIKTSEHWSNTDTPSRLSTAADAGGKPIVVYFVPELRLSKPNRDAILSDLGTLGVNKCRVVLMNVKFSWLVTNFDGNGLKKSSRGKKPGQLVKALLKPVTP